VKSLKSCSQKTQEKLQNLLPASEKELEKEFYTIIPASSPRKSQTSFNDFIFLHGIYE